jgi:hypothetical protein
MNSIVRQRLMQQYINLLGLCSTISEEMLCGSTNYVYQLFQIRCERTMDPIAAMYITYLTFIRVFF